MARKRKKTRRYDSKRRKKDVPMIQLIGGAVIVIVIANLAIQMFGAAGAAVYPNVDPDAEILTTATGLQYQEISVGTGAEAVAGQSVSVHYTGWVTDGTQFDSSVDRGIPFDFQLGVGQVIQGWDQGVAGMKVGGTRILIIPPDLGYGDVGAGADIPPGATLIFRVDLLGVGE